VPTAVTSIGTASSVATATLTGVRRIDFAESALGDAQPLRQRVTTRRALDGDSVISTGLICAAARFAREFGLLNWGLSINLYGPEAFLFSVDAL
jgi:hypothetical protein